MKTKRFLSAILIFAMIFSVVGAIQLPAFAATGDELAAALPWSVIANDQNKTDVTANLNLVGSVNIGGNSTNVTWTSSNPEAITVDGAVGTVTRAIKDKAVTLTATAGSASVNFNVVVSGKLDGDVLTAENFDAKTAGSTFGDTGNVLLTYQNDASDDGNKVLDLETQVGFRTLTAAEKAEIDADEFTLTSGNYTYYLKNELKTNATGSYYVGYRSDRTDYWAGVYVVEDGENPGTYVIDGSKVLANARWIYEDGSPYISGDGRPGTSTTANLVSLTGVLANGQPNAANVGVARVGFSYAAKEVPTGVDRNHAGFAVKFSSSYPLMLWITPDSIGITDSYNPVFLYGNKVTGTAGVTAVTDTGWIGKTAETPEEVLNTVQLEKMSMKSTGEWTDFDLRIDYVNKNVRLFLDGKPVYWEIKENGTTIGYTSLFNASNYNSAYAPDYRTYFSGTRFYPEVHGDFVIDNYNVKYITKTNMDTLNEQLIEEYVDAFGWNDISNGQMPNSVTSALNLVATIPNTAEALTWSSSDETVVALDGTVTKGLETGYATLTAYVDGVAIKNFAVIVPGTLDGSTLQGAYPSVNGTAGEAYSTGYLAGGGVGGTKNVEFTYAYVNGTDGDTALKFDMKVGFRALSAADKSAIDSAADKVTLTSGSYTYHLKNELKTNSKGNYLVGYRSDNTGFWSSVYVTGDGTTESPYAIADASQVKANSRWIYEDGSPYTENDGRPDLWTTKTEPLSASKFNPANGGQLAISFRYYTMPVANGVVTDNFCFPFIIGRNDAPAFSLTKTGITYIESGSHTAKFDDTTNVTFSGTTKWVGKNGSVAGVVDTTADLEAMQLGGCGTWTDVKVVYDFNGSAPVARLFIDGKPVYWAVTSNGATKYSSEMVMINETACPTVTFKANRSYVYVDSDFLIDDYYYTGIQAQGQADALVENLSLVKAPVVDSAIVGNNGVTLSALNPSIGFGTEEATVTASATVKAATASKAHTITVKQKRPYTINAVTMSKAGAPAYVPAAGVTIDSVNVTVNDARTSGAIAYVAIYNGGVIKQITGYPITETGDVAVGITLAAGDTYRVFVFDGEIRPCDFAKDVMPAAKAEIKLFVLGDAVGKTVEESLEGALTQAVTVDATAALNGMTAEKALSTGKFSAILEAATAGDYLVLAVGEGEAAKYDALVTQMVKAAQDKGVIVVVIGADNVATACGAPAATAATIKTTLAALPIAAYIK